MAKKYLNEEGVKTVFELLKGNNNTGSNIEIVQETGESTTAVMSQKAVTDALKDVNVGGENVNADWDAEEGEDGFIKNKPFGEVEEPVLFAYTSYANATTKSGNGYGGYQMTFYNQGHSDSSTHSYDISKKYKVVINDVSYDNLIPHSNGFLSDDYTGSYQPLYENSNFILMTANDAGNGTMYFKEPLPLDSTIEIYQYNTTIKQIDPKYLPIVQETGDSETSIMSQKAVTDALKNCQGAEDNVSNVPEINQIVYSTIDGKAISISQYYIDDYIESNIYYPNKGFGVITFKEDLTEPFFSEFSFNGKSDVSKLKSVVLPEGVTILPTSFLNYANNLESVELPSTITKFEGSNHFYNCTKLNSITLPNISEISDFCFYQCYSLNHITLPNSVTKICRYAFYYSGISNIDLNNVTEIETYAFRYSQLISLDTKGVQTIGEYAFSDCNDLNSILFNYSLKELGSYCFEYCRSLNNVNFIQNSSLQTIPDNCFYYCTSLNEISIDSNISSIGSNAFSYCPLRSITIHSSTIQSYNNAFYMDSGRPTLEYFYTKSTAPLQTMNSYYTIKTIVLDVSSFVELSTSSLSNLRNFATIYVNANLIDQYRTTYADYAQLFKPITGTEVGTMYWVGTKEEYELIEDKNMDTIYYILEDEENV